MDEIIFYLLSTALPKVEPGLIWPAGRFVLLKLL